MHPTTANHEKRQKTWVVVICQQANGTQGRVVSWSPEKPDNDKQALLASHPDLTARFVKEASVTKRELVADIDFMDVGPRQENLTTIAGFPIMLQTVSG